MATVTVFSEEEIQTSTPYLSIFEDLRSIEDILSEQEELEQFFINL